jgi:hypothetical protein
LEAKHFFPRTDLWQGIFKELFPAEEFVDDGFEILVLNTPGEAKIKFIRKFMSLKP